MIWWFRNIAAYLICSIAAVAVLRWIESPVIMQSLLGNLSAIVLALLAINVQTIAVIAVKLRELVDRAGAQQALSVREFRIAIYEQACLVLFALALQSTVGARNIQVPEVVVSVGALFVLFAALHIFLDTTHGLLIALFPESD